jgi:hypothetical protein
MVRRLSADETHFIRLIARDANDDGWTKVSAMLYPLVEKMPRELVELWPTESGGRARLTDEGSSVLSAMLWLTY